MLLISEHIPIDITRGIMISTRFRSYKRLIEKEYAGTEYEIHKYAMNEAAVMKATKVS